MHLIKDMDPRGKLVAYFDICDGCAVQYRCSQVLHSLALLAKSKGIRVYEVIIAPGHGKSRIDTAVRRFGQVDGEMDGNDVEEEDDKEEDDSDNSQVDSIEADEDTSEEVERK